ncbi:tripartite tricarboxylate transporter substrate binding protein [Reyranella sp. CPCC 100927]|uniref:Bug family tripartite tricarboxylate transporter substrate binding protein n=1 Tax=Reyranella sp. CPCC 100927 TaxID=2599616 RepID=UPI0011B84E5B|nr:tripartite tricarboxylate transporter substrate binding protein [Reyranella sp. CPCC 100927]TWT11825.1 tripartite tricarboxylate transporter substrate binding protein [Reyranella sp. CPCC 100927]
MRRLALIAVSALVCGGVLASAPPADAEVWPARLVRIVVPYGPGGGVDAFARPIAAALNEQLPHRVVIDNRSGAGGTIGVLNAAQSPADGATILAGGVHQPMSEALYPTRGYRIDKDFVPITITAMVPNILVVPTASRFTSVRQIIEAAKADPGKLSYCSSGNGTSQHIIAEMFKRSTGTDLLHVPYRGTAPALKDLMGGFCDMMFDGLGTSAPQIAGGRLRAIAVTTSRRSALLTDVPTLAEAGGPPLDVATWYALWARASTDPAMIEHMRAAVRQALDAPAVRQVWQQQGAEIPDISVDAITAFVARETRFWTATVSELGIKSD